MKNLFLAISLFVASVSSFASANTTFQIGSYNIRNFIAVDSDDFNQLINGPTNVEALTQAIGDMKSDIISFQEVINLPLFETIMATYFPNIRLISTECGGTAEQKLVLAFNENLFRLDRYVEDERVSLTNRCNFGLRPALVVYLTHKKTRKKIAVVSVHLKAGAGERNRSVRREQHEVLKTVLDEIKDQDINDIIVLGDFNTTSFIEQTPGAVQFDHFLALNQLRNTTERVGCTSYWQGDDNGDPHFMPSHLDHILHYGYSRILSSAVQGHCQKNSCEPSLEQSLGLTFTGVSDHCPIVSEFRLSR